MTTCADVIVIGLGAMGSSAFCRLASAGQRVIGIDRYRPPHSHGSSHGETRMIRRTTFLPERYLPLTHRTYELWQELERQTDTELLRLTGGLMLGTPDSGVVHRCVDCHTNWGVDGELLDAADIGRRFPQFNLPDGHCGFYERDAGYLLLNNCIEAHLELGIRNGGDARFDETIVRWHVQGDRVHVETTRGQYESTHLVIAAGPWTNETGITLKLPICPERQVLHWFQPRTSIDRFSSPAFPVYIWETANETWLYGFPAYDSGQPGIKLSLERHGDFCTQETIARDVSPNEISEVRDCVQQYIPELAGEHLDSATCMYSMTSDDQFVMGRHPQHDQVIVLAGFVGTGFKFAAVAGEVAQQLVVDGHSALLPEAFSPSRFAVSANE